MRKVEDLTQDELKRLAALLDLVDLERLEKIAAMIDEVRYRTGFGTVMIRVKSNPQDPTIYIEMTISEKCVLD